MKTAFRLSVLVIIAVYSVAGCGEDPPEPANFVSASPTAGSTIEPDAAISVLFDDVPRNVVVNPGRATTAGQTVTISGPFTAGPLNITITWKGGAYVLSYTVTAPEKDAPEKDVTAPAGMVSIPAGEFEMGSNDPEAQNHEQPVHTVSIDAFFMDEHEVTNLEYKKFVLANPRWQKARIDKRFGGTLYLSSWNGNDYPNGKSNHPVVYVTWYGAMAYASWVEKRLPTEAEWEYAARGGLAGKKYPWGDGIGLGKANYGKNVGGTTPVGKYPANGYGLYDMAGNMWEWCLDEYDKDFYFGSPRKNPLSGANSVQWVMNNFTNVKTKRVLRGGSWNDDPKILRVATRGSYPPSSTWFTHGFRCARAQ